eukprot:CAMPEP_0202713560 /NCGR_PEP_ID=MMETSP1385-20130828/56124_1 /ASSEMBLY_ACC=CAM_ASM_000861 /TAXON_ID=933848 /ORGANISM="Elphidium margaritaceum" /LENGTH=431 /DNA_ID=CAMNT_0049373953 /DNA_START=194 /DNA_END=1489 /DNA_ORIENTATION=-
MPQLSNKPPPLPLLQQYFQTISKKGVKFEARPIYLDSQATTRIDPRVVDIMNQYHVEQWGNPHSSTHLYGWETDEAVENARKQIARLISANPKEIIFTSGATESNNLAIKGLAMFPRRKEKRHIITTQTEHKCVLDSCRHLESQGFDVTYLQVQDNGLVDVEVLRAAIRDDTLLVSCMFVNNEIGVIQPIAEIGALCREKGVYFHCDAAQGLGKLAIDVDAMNIDLMSMSGHKIYGPKGIGALYIRRRPRVQLKPIINGGGQERGLRSGTLPAPLCVGFGLACEVAQECMEEDHEHITRLSQRLYAGLTAELEELVLNGDPQSRYEGNLNLSIAFVEGESLIMGLKNICVSSGSACTSASLEPSYVLRGIGVTEDLAHTSIRFGIGRFTTEQEIDFTIKETVHQVKRLRDMSPLYDLFKEGKLGQIEWAAH